MYVNVHGLMVIKITVRVHYVIPKNVPKCQ